MGIRNWPLWLKGGIIGVVIQLFFFLQFWYSAAHYHPFHSNTRLYMYIALPPFMLLDSFGVVVDSLAFWILLSAGFYFGLGALIGYAVVKYRRPRKKKSGEFDIEI